MNAGFKRGNKIAFFGRSAITAAIYGIPLLGLRRLDSPPDVKIVTERKSKIVRVFFKAPASRTHHRRISLFGTRRCDDSFPDVVSERSETDQKAAASRGSLRVKTKSSL